MAKCLICGKEMEKQHTWHKHKLNYKDYYDTYIKTETDGICVVCGKPTSWDRNHYKETCSIKCAARNPKRQEKIKQTNLKRYGVPNVYMIDSIHQKSINTIKQKSINNKKDKKDKKVREYTCLYCKKNCKIKHFCSEECKIKYKQSGGSYNNREKAIQTCIDLFNGKMNSGAWDTRHQKLDQFEIDNNCIRTNKLIQQYGQGWLSLNLPRIYMNNQNTFISNEYLPQIQEYSSHKHVNLKGKAESYIINHLEYNGRIEPNNRRIISPKELDIYIPDLKLAIEYNGTYWHAEERQNNIYFHREKSIHCHNLNIRLIHIYEFEDLDDQIYKVNQLIKGIDLFEQIFTKNSLLSIPNEEPYILYKDEKSTIYSA